MAQEYERRFLLSRLPPADPLSETLIRQVFWDLGNGWSLRLRRTGTDPDTENSLTVKGPRHGSARWEYEQHLTNDDDSDAGNDLHDTLDGVLDLYRAGSAHTVVKLRRSYLVGDQAWDVDEFLWDNVGLLIGELEADSQAGVSHIIRPEWAVQEVTLDARYDNMQLAYRPYNTWSGNNR